MKQQFFKYHYFTNPHYVSRNSRTMKILTASILTLFFSVANGQKITSTVSLSDHIKLKGIIERFDASKHKIDTCTYEFTFKHICRIDGKKWYGSDQGLELPRTHLKQLKIYINKKPVSLDVSGMFNPRFGYELSEKQFKLVKKGTQYLLYGYFSDGAGTYTAHWRISNGKSTRIKISNDERDFTWQSN
jgi:hypothetical protein